MTVTNVTYTGNGTTTLYSLPFPYLQESSVKVTVNGSLVTNYIFVNSTTIEFTAAPANGAQIIIYRETDVDEVEATFFAGSAIKAKDLNQNFAQSIYTLQELVTQALSKLGGTMQGILNMGGFKITNLGTPSSGSDAATKAYADLKVTKAGDTMSGNLDMGTNRVINLGPPQVDADSATKKYVDDRYGVLTVPGFTRWRKVATNGQTTFSGAGDFGGTLAYSSSREEVYINGVLQQRSVDYTADNGTSVVFNVGLIAGDVVEVVCVNNVGNGTPTDQSSGVYFTQAGSGAVTRTVDSKLKDVVSVKDFGAVGDGVADDKAAIQAAVDSGAKAVYFPAGTYLIQASAGIGVSVNSSLVLFGDGMNATVIKSAPTMLSDNENYSNNLFTTAPALDELTIKDMTLDGAGTGSGGPATGHEYALVLTYNVNRLSFENLRVTQYSSNWDGTSKSVYNRHFQAITVRNNANTEHTRFANVQLRDNHYEQVDVYHPHTSQAWTIIDKCSEINVAVIPDSHTAFMVTGGHMKLTNSYFKNTKFSTININNTKSALVDSNQFIDQYQLQLSQVVNVGHSLWYGCDNTVITNNYFRNCDASAISHAGGSAIIIANNVIIDGGLNPVRLRAALINDGSPSGFAVAFPDYPVPTIGVSYDVKIANNIIAGATYTSGASSRSLWLSYTNPNDGYWFNVEILGNTISMLNPPDDTHYPMWINEAEEINIVENYFNYKFSSFFSDGKTDHVRIVGNTFAASASTSGNDIVFTGGGGSIASKELRIEGNRFVFLPRTEAKNIVVGFGRTFDGIFILNNVNTKTEGLIDTTSPYYASNTLAEMVTAAPTSGIYRKFDRVATVPAPGVPPEYVCYDPGCFATFTATASGTAGQYTLTVTDGSQFTPGQRIQVNGVGPGGSFRYFIVCDVVGNTVHVDRPVLTTASGQAVSAVNPTFVKTSDYT